MSLSQSEFIRLRYICIEKQREVGKVIDRERNRLIDMLRKRASNRQRQRDSYSYRLVDNNVFGVESQ